MLVRRVSPAWDLRSTSQAPTPDAEFRDGWGPSGMTHAHRGRPRRLESSAPTHLPSGVVDVHIVMAFSLQALLRPTSDRS